VRAWCALAALLVAASASSVGHAANDAAACRSAYEQTQTLRKEGKLAGAHAQAEQCMLACRAGIRDDCVTWLAAIEASQPTVVFEVRGPGGQDTTAVRVLLDGIAVKDRLDGRALPVDPGDHALRFELEGAAPVVERVTIREGEKNRKITVSFAKDTPAEPIKPPATSVPVLTWIFGGVGLAAMAAGGALWGVGRGNVAGLRDSCAPHCSQAQVDRARVELNAGDVAFFSGLGLAAVGAVLLVAAPRAAAPATASAPVTISLQPTSASLILRF
jgi:hypothetical protein